MVAVAGSPASSGTGRLQPWGHLVAEAPISCIHGPGRGRGRSAATGYGEGKRMAGSGRERILAIDVVRGLAVVGMLLVNNAGIPTAMPQELRHASWQGLTLADQVFPLFLFSVGASMPFSQRAQRPGAVLRRVVVLFLLGSLLGSAQQEPPGPPPAGVRADV